MINYFIIRIGMKWDNLNYDELKNKCHSHEIERSVNWRDQWGNWEASFGDLPYDFPFLDNLRLLQEGKKRSVWPNDAPFAICLTHDIDSITSSNHPKIALNNLSKKKYLKSGLSKLMLQYSILKQQIKKTVVMEKTDPFWQFEKWIEVEQKHGFKSTFFSFMRPSNEALSEFDCDYFPDDITRFRGIKMTGIDLIKEIDKTGCEIGLHGSYNSFNSINILKSQKDRLEQIVGKEVVSSRQHYLHYDINSTPNVHKEVGLKIDSTLGFNKSIGFRAGTCFPYQILNEKYEATGVWEIPQIIMDLSLFSNNGLELNLDLAIERCIRKMDQVEKVGGCLTLNFHPEHIALPHYFALYSKILEEAKHRNAFNGSTADFYNLAKGA
ncbi:MAG: peptidoglycan/xylan/chitin deacetylase (PgdA/CDA1 family) [Salibacteraceae bacterium]